MLKQSLFSAVFVDTNAVAFILFYKQASQLFESVLYTILVRQYFNYRAQIYNIIQQLSEIRRKNKAICYNRKIVKAKFNFENYIFIFQKTTIKLKSR